MSMRTIFLISVAYLGTTAVVVAGDLFRGESIRQPVRAPSPRGTGAAWFAQLRSRCNPLEVAVALKDSPPPSHSDGQGYAAACWALAGKIDQARRVIEAMEPAHREYAASVVFYIAHPVADHGDDVAAGPMMELVLEYKPNDYMARYHAGMSEYALGRVDQAKVNLTEFRRLYSPTDFFGKNADDTLDRIARGLPPASVSPGAHD